MTLLHPVNIPVEMKPLPKEPDYEERKKYKLKAKAKKLKDMDKPNISHPTNFEHTVHVGFDSTTGEFTVSGLFCLVLVLIIVEKPDFFALL